ncbi:hypothetical protein ACFLWR_07005 [Chloroflexota bacterium]
MPYIADLEKEGIPSVLLYYHEQKGKIENDLKLYGVSHLRMVQADRKSPGGIDEADKVMQPLLDALTKPLNVEEKQGSEWRVEEPRILFEGTLEEAEIFYAQTENIEACLNTPFCVYTDGLPVVIPTEERVKEMLTGTSHKPDELITIQRDMEIGSGEMTIKRKKGDLVRFMPMYRSATVEQVAVNAVMAGCKPEQFPVALAIAESGGGTGDGRGGGGAFIISGPIYKEIGITVTNNIFGQCNPVNKALARLGCLLWRNFGGYKETVTTIMTVGNPVLNGGMILAEYDEGLPLGWQGLNEEMGFKKDESIIMTIPVGHSSSAWGIGGEHMPGVYRSLQRTGHGAIARYLDVKGIVGPHNYLEYFCKGIWASREGGFTIAMPPQIAQDMYDYGFKTKQSIYEYFWKQSFEPVSEYRKRGTPDYRTNGWLGIEKTSGKHWKELPDDYMVPTGGDDPFTSFNVIVFNMEETQTARFTGGHTDSYSIDAWR